MKSPIKPIGYRVVIRQDAVEETSKGGIILSSREQGLQRSSQHVGTLVAQGPAAFTGEDFGEDAKKDIPNGTRVLYKRYAGQVYKFKDEDSETASLYHLCSDADIQGIPEEDAEMVNDYN